MIVKQLACIELRTHNKIFKKNQQNLHYRKSSKIQ
jgi:hypothetical protein